MTGQVGAQGIGRRPTHILAHIVERQSCAGLEQVEEDKEQRGYGQGGGCRAGLGGIQHVADDLGVDQLKGNRPQQEERQQKDASPLGGEVGC